MEDIVNEIREIVKESLDSQPSSYAYGNQWQEQDFDNSDGLILSHLKNKIQKLKCIRNFVLNLEILV